MSTIYKMQEEIDSLKKELLRKEEIIHFLRKKTAQQAEAIVKLSTTSEQPYFFNPFTSSKQKESDHE